MITLFLRVAMSKMKIAATLAVVLVTMVASLAAIETTHDTELRDLDITGRDCANQSEGTAQSQDAKERNHMKNHWPVNPSARFFEKGTHV